LQSVLPDEEIVAGGGKIERGKEKSVIVKSDNMHFT
jgi:hypothetical protein